MPDADFSSGRCRCFFSRAADSNETMMIGSLRIRAVVLDSWSQTGDCSAVGCVSGDMPLQDRVQEAARPLSIKE